MPSTDHAWRQPVARTLTLAWLESLTIRRDPVILAMILLIPTLQIVLFGYAIRPLSGEAPVVIARVETDPALVNLLRDSGAFRVVADGLSRDAALARLRAQDALIAIVIPPPLPAADRDKTAPTATTGDDAVRVIVDDSDLVRTDPALARLEALYWRRAAEGDPFRPPEVRVERLYNPERRPEWVLTPGLSGVVAMISMLMLGALSIVRERARGTWETLLATPVHAAEAVVGKALPYLVLGLVQAVLVIVACATLFGLPLRGDLWAFGLFLVVYLFAHLVMGLTISATARSQLQAVQGAVLVYLPSMLLSGFIFPFSTMPTWAQRLGAVLPLTYYNEVARGVMLRGADAAFVHARTWPVFVIATVALLAAVGTFRRQRWW